MNILNDIYEKKLAENEGKLRFWEDYLKSLKALDFSQFSDKLTVPLLVPVGSRIFFRGYLKHTNEVTVALGADYFTKCSLQQGEILRQHRIKDAESKLDTFKKEKEYLESQISFNKENVFGNVGQEIIELHTEEEDRAWREKHRQNVREYYQRKDKKEETQSNEIPDEVLWNRLEELELQEELENELSKLGNSEEMELMIEDHKLEKENNENCKKNGIHFSNLAEVKKDNDFLQLDSKPTQKLDLLQQVLDKQNELESKLTELKNRDRISSKTESDLMSRLDELEQLDELEDEMERLDDILHEDNDEFEEDDNKSNIKIKRRVSFADEDESETLELTFKHSKIEPCNIPYNPEIGIMKPSDIYAIYSHLFTETTSILRKSKYESNVTEVNIGQEKNFIPTVIPQNINTESRLIVVKDIKEKEVDMENAVDTVETRPISIFKKRRQQKS